MTKHAEHEISLMNDSTPRRVEGFTLEHFDAEVLLFNAAKDEALYLNATSAMIWGLCDGAHTVNEILALIAKSYPDSAAAIEQDVHETLKSLLRHGAIALP